MTKEHENTIIENIIKALGTYNLGNIKDSRRIYEDPVNINIMLATFILCSCFIDQMAQIRYYKDGTLGDNFRKFVRNYFGPKYKPKLLYDSLRSRLVHNYSVNGKYWLTDERKYKHLQLANGRIYLNIDDFIKEIEDVWLKLKNDLLTNADTRQHAINHEKDYPILKENI